MVSAAAGLFHVGPYERDRFLGVEGFAMLAVVRRTHRNNVRRGLVVVVLCSWPSDVCSDIRLLAALSHGALGGLFLAVLLPML